MAEEINRRLLNDLSMVWSFLDLGAHRLSGRFGKDSDELAAFREATHRAYDSSFAYRFLDRLRNYAQHCGLPVGQFGLLEAVDRDAPSGVRVTMEVQFARDQLLRESDMWNARVRKELEDGPPLIDVTSCVSEMMEQLKGRNASLLAPRVVAIIAGVRRIIGLLDPVRKQVGVPCIADYSGVSDKGGDLRIEWIPLDAVIELVNQLGDEHFDRLTDLRLEDFFTIVDEPDPAREAGGEAS
jgi:hypothetical protein